MNGSDHPHDFAKAPLAVPRFRDGLGSTIPCLELDLTMTIDERDVAKTQLARRLEGCVELLLAWPPSPSGEASPQRLLHGHSLPLLDRAHQLP
jgi:hypothetical protein